MPSSRGASPQGRIDPEREPLGWYASVLRRLRPRGSRLLQVECGGGDLLRLLADHFDAYGFDARPRERSRCRMNVPNAVVLEDWDERPEDGFDVVVSVGAFGRRGARAQVRGLLPSVGRGGVLVLIVPNPSGWASRLKGRAWQQQWQGDGEALLSPGEWKTLLRAAGLELASAQGDGLWNEPYVPLVPTAVQRLVCDAVFAVRSALPVPAAWSSGRFGERLILVAERGAGA
jgi:hypothetical protein